MELHVPVHPVRVVTATTLFDGHDASINMVRRLLQSQGAEVVHLGHHRSVEELVRAVQEEDAQAVAVGSYQGGHMEMFRYLVDRLRAGGSGHVLVYGGGGGVILPSEVAELQAYGVRRIFTPDDGHELGLAGMVNTIVADGDVDLAADPAPALDAVVAGGRVALSRAITVLEAGRAPAGYVEELAAVAARRRVPVLGITGTGGAGKSSLVDELLRRIRLDQQDKVRVAVLAVDPSRRRGGGALLGDRIRMNAIDGPSTMVRSMATRGRSELPEHIGDVVTACQAAGFDLVVVETPGIGQGDAGVLALADVALYVMTPEYGAATQLEKIDMLELADVVAINKYDRRGGADALRAVRRQLARERGGAPDDQPVVGTMASRVGDDGVTALYQELRSRLVAEGLVLAEGVLAPVDVRASSAEADLVPAARRGYLGEIAAAIRRYHATTDEQVAAVRDRAHLRGARALVAGDGPAAVELDGAMATVEPRVERATDALLDGWPAQCEAVSAPELHRTSPSGTAVSRVAVPRFDDDATLLRWLRAEHLPGHFPFTAGVFPLRRSEEPTRMFAGEGGPSRTNRRFHLLADGREATRLSTAFDSVTLYGADPDERPDIYGKVGNAGVSIATVDDVATLFAGFDLCDPTTSVSMTINGPAPTILAMYLTHAIEAELEREAQRQGRPLTDDEVHARRAWVLAHVRGTVQADILKEDQAQNTCIFSTDFALRMMADIQEWFVAERVRHFYSVSISGYHMAEAGANPISQLAFTLANAFTYVEAYLARGMAVDDFAHNLSFFFSNGMDPEYTVLGRVARRIWAVAMRDRYGAGERAQKLKYHIQTSGRSLHAREMSFNDIRTTLQALCATYDAANSLHTNAFDEAVTTPTEASVRRALAIQLIINREWGLAMNENPLQGSFVVEELTDLVEEAVLAELDQLNERGGVLGAMELGYQRARIQDESMRYEHAKADGSLPIVGVNVFRGPDEAPPSVSGVARSSDDEKQDQLRRLHDFQTRHAAEREQALTGLRRTALEGGNLFAELMVAVRSCTLGEISEALYDVGGRFRRSL